MRLNHEKTPVITAIREYQKLNVIPFDVPGHKRGRGIPELVDFFGEDILDIDYNSMKCLDNIGNPKGVIKEAHELMADLYGADHAFFLTNGTTSGVQAMIMSACDCGDQVILPRNVHKSVINGLIIAGVRPVYIQPEVNYELGITIGVTPERVEEAILQHPNAKAVFLINPTYYGVVSDLKAIIEICKKHDKAVLVDEAHGAHLPFHEDLPAPAMSLGADMAAVSLHKTGGSLTQSSVLLLKEGKIQKSRVNSILNMMQTTSASYLLMASLDGARKILATRGKEIFDKALHIARYAREEINKIPHFYAFGKELIDGKGVFNYDETKLSINTSQLGITGLEVYDILRNEYMIQMELADVHNVMAIISLGDNIENVEALIAALKDISAKYKKDKVIKNTVVLENPEVVVPPREAFYKHRSSMPIEESEGKISGEFFMVYPPGIPILTPGERITKEILKYIRILKEEKAVFTDNSDPEIKTIMVID